MQLKQALRLSQLVHVVYFFLTKKKNNKLYTLYTQILVRVDWREKPRCLRRLVFVKIFFYKFYCNKVESETVAKNYGMSIKKSPSVVFLDC